MKYRDIRCTSREFFGVTCCMTNFITVGRSERLAEATRARATSNTYDREMDIHAKSTSSCVTMCECLWYKHVTSAARSVDMFRLERASMIAAVKSEFVCNTTCSVERN